MIREADTDDVGDFVVSQRSARTHIAREQMLARHAMLLPVLILRVSCVFSQEQFTMSGDPWCGLESARDSAGARV